jgi:glycosyltransferase involved in cell wall biosynthesis
MNNAAIYLNPEAFRTSGPMLMGRQSAGEGFLKGFIRNADIDTLHLWNVAGARLSEVEPLISALEPPRTPVNWIGRAERNRLREAGAVMLANARVAREAWARRSVGEHAYSICGITHTTASQNVCDFLSELAYAPVEPWDALICTSRAVRESVETQIDSVAEYLRARLGAVRTSRPRLETIPLGVNTDQFRTSPEERQRWREELDIPADAIVALYVGRFNAMAKMNPVPMALALERAAKTTGAPLYWVAAGWSTTPKADELYHSEVRRACPSVAYRVVDGRRPDVRFSIWSAADFFISLSDNVQETFGLTPVEAMAAGLPSVISDWNGYRDTVRHELDGFRISTCAPRSGLGADLAFRHSQEWLNYDGYVGAASQFTSVDIDEATQAVVDLIRNPVLRAGMGASAAEQARRVFDWSVVIPQYQALWAELARIRPKTPASRPRGQADNPWRLDPFALFASYPTEALSGRTRIALAPDVPEGAAAALLEQAINETVRPILPNVEELERLVASLRARRQASVTELLSEFPISRRLHLERALLWLAKYGLVAITPGAARMPN